MASLWQRVRDKISPPKPAPEPAKKQSPANNYFNTPTTTIGSGGLQSTTPVQQATSGKVQTVTPSRGGGGGSSGRSGPVAGPMPQGTTPAQEAEFRETGRVSTPIVRTASTSATQVQAQKPVSTLTKAPTFQEKYKSSVAESGYVRGTLSFLGSQVSEKSEMGRDWLAQRGLTNYDPRVSPIVGGVAKTAPYFVPVAGGLLLAGGGVEEVGTRAGRQRILSGAESMEQAYGVPKAVGVTAGYGLNIASIGVGGRAFLSDINKLGGIPKSQTTFIGTEQKLTNVQGQPKVITELRFKTTQKNFFIDRTSFGVSKTSTNIIRTTDGGLSLGESVTFGVSKKTAVTPFGKVTTYGKPNQFNIISKSVSGEGQISIVKAGEGLQTSRMLDVGKSISVGKGIAGKNIFTAPVKATKFQFVSTGFSRKAGDIIGVAGKTRTFSAGKITGKGNYAGLILSPEKVDVGGRVIMSGGKVGTTPFTSLSQQSQQIAFQQTSAGLVSKTTPSLGGFKVPSVPFFQSTRTEIKTIQQPTTSQVFIQQPKEEIRTTQLVPPITRTTPRTRGGVVNIVGNIPKVDQPQKIAPITISIPKVTPKQSSKMSPLGGYSIAPIPFTPFTPLPFAFPKFLGSDASGGLGKIKAQRTYRYTPSFGALALKGQKFKVGETTTKRFTGLEFRGTKQKKKKIRSIFGFKF